jgi:hypothetical protein
MVWRKPTRLIRPATACAALPSANLGDQPIVVLKPPAAPVGNPDQVDLGTDTGLDFSTTGKTSSQVGASAAVGTEVFYVYADHLGTPRWIARASDNKVVWRWETAEAFGNSFPNDNASGISPGSIVCRRKVQFFKV